MIRPTRFSTAADWWYATLYLHEQLDEALAGRGMHPAWMDRVGLWLCRRYDASNSPECPLG